MEFYLMQHGPQLPKEEDPEESLSPGGEALVSASAQAVRKMGLSFDVIVHEPQETSEADGSPRRRGHRVSPKRHRRDGPGQGDDAR